jgi:hypothetical protein
MTTTTEAPFAGDVDEPDHASVPLSPAQVGDHGVYLERRLSRKASISKGSGEQEPGVVGLSGGEDRQNPRFGPAGDHW